MVSTATLAIVIPILFVILFQLIRVAQGTTVLTDLEGREYHPPGEKPTIDYEPFPRYRLAHWMADLLPTLGRWGTGIGVFGLLHFTITSYLLVVSVSLAYIGATDNPVAYLGTAGLVVVWFILPFFEVEEYDKLSQRGLRPKSIDYHVTAVFFELLMVSGTVALADTVSNFASGAGSWVIILGGYAVLHHHNLVYNPTFVAMLSQEISAIENLEESQQVT